MKTGGAITKQAKEQDGETISTVLANELAEEMSHDEVDSELENIKKKLTKTFTIEDKQGSGEVK
jgi:hypothetical protein